MVELREIAGRMRHRCQSPPTWKSILICTFLLVSFLPPAWSVSFPPRHPRLVFDLHFHLTSCSASHSFRAGLSIRLMVALDLKRSKWMGPCSSKPGHLASLLYCLLALSSWDPISITLPYSPLHGLSSLLPHGCCTWWL